MLQAVVSQNSHCRGHADAVICAQRRAVCANPFAVHISLNGIFGEVEHLVRVLLGHHVHMCLQNHARLVFVAFRGGLADDHVADLLLDRLQSQTAAIVGQKITNLFLYARRTRDASKCVEIFPHLLRFQVFQFHIFFTSCY